MRRLCDDLSGILGVPVEVDGENGLLPTTSIQPVGLIVNELVINAAKHGAGKVNVTYRCNGVSKITVCDEGIGLPPGFDPATNANGLGMKIADVLAKQLGGTFAAGANPAGKGACSRLPSRGDVPGFSDFRTRVRSPVAIRGKADQTLTSSNRRN